MASQSYRVSLSKMVSLIYMANLWFMANLNYIGNFSYKLWMPQDTPTVESVLSKFQVCVESGQIYIVQDVPLLSRPKIQRGSVPDLSLNDHKFLVAKMAWEELQVVSEYIVSESCEYALSVFSMVENKIRMLAQLITSCARTVFYERPLGVRDIGDPKGTLSTNFLTLGRKLRQFVHSTLDGDAAKQYFSFFNAKCITRGETFWQGGATFAKVWIVPETNDWALVGHKSGDLRMGKMVGIIISDNGEIIKVIHIRFFFSEFQVITNLRLLECHDNNKSVENQINDVMDSRPQRKAAKVALNKIKKM